MDQNNNIRINNTNNGNITHGFNTPITQGMQIGGGSLHTNNVSFIPNNDTGNNNSNIFNYSNDNATMFSGIKFRNNDINQMNNETYINNMCNMNLTNMNGMQNVKNLQNNNVQINNTERLFGEVKRNVSIFGNRSAKGPLFAKVDISGRNNRNDDFCLLNFINADKSIFGNRLKENKPLFHKRISLNNNYIDSFDNTSIGPIRDMIRRNSGSEHNKENVIFMPGLMGVNQSTQGNNFFNQNNENRGCPFFGNKEVKNQGNYNNMNVENNSNNISYSNKGTFGNDNYFLNNSCNVNANSPNSFFYMNNNINTFSNNMNTNVNNNVNFTNKNDNTSNVFQNTPTNFCNVPIGHNPNFNMSVISGNVDNLQRGMINTVNNERGEFISNVVNFNNNQINQQINQQNITLQQNNVLKEQNELINNMSQSLQTNVFGASSVNMNTCTVTSTNPVASISDQVNPSTTNISPLMTTTAPLPSVTAEIAHINNNVKELTVRDNNKNHIQQNNISSVGEALRLHSVTGSSGNDSKKEQVDKNVESKITVKTNEEINTSTNPSYTNSSNVTTLDGKVNVSEKVDANELKKGIDTNKENKTAEVSNIYKSKGQAEKEHLHNGKKKVNFLSTEIVKTLEENNVNIFNNYASNRSSIETFPCLQTCDNSEFYRNVIEECKKEDRFQTDDKFYEKVHAISQKKERTLMKKVSGDVSADLFDLPVYYPLLHLEKVQFREPLSIVNKSKGTGMEIFELGKIPTVI